MGRLISVKDAVNQVTDYRYDPANRIAKVSQWPGASRTGTPQIRTWTYDGRGWLTQLVQPESGTTTYSSFDVNGKPWTTNYNGRVVNSTFDTMGRVKTVKSVDATVNQSFLHDQQETGHGLSNNKLIKATDASVVKSLIYSGLNGRLSRLTRTLDGQTFSQNLTYDTYGYIKTRQYPDGKLQSINYDYAKGSPSSSGFGSATDILTYDPITWNLSKLGAFIGTAKATTNYTYYDNQTRLATLEHLTGTTALKKWTYGYDAAGRLLTDGEDSYTYDALNRLVTAAVADPLGTQGLFQSFTYDAFGNRISATTSTATNWTPPNAVPSPLTKSSTLRSGLSTVTANLTFTAGSAALLKNQLPATTSSGAQTGALYDAQGNLTHVYPRVGASAEAITMTYDALARVTSMTSGPTSARKNETYLYDDEGLRIRVWDGAKYRYNIYNEARQLVAQYGKTPTGSLTWQKDIVYIGTKEVAEVAKDGKTYTTLCDPLGSPRYIWDGTTITKQKFLPFGEQLTDPTSMGKFAKGYTNHEQTDASGLIYMQARFYLPMYGRFGSPDPARDQHFEFTQTWNIYSYVTNIPTTHTDPTGMLDPDYHASLGSRKPNILIVHDTGGLLTRNGFDGMKKSGQTAGHVFINTDGRIWENKPLSQNATATRAEWATAAPEKKIDTNKTVNVELNAAKNNPSITTDQISSLAQVAVSMLVGTEGPLTIAPHKEIDRGIQGAHDDVRDFNSDAFRGELMRQCVEMGVPINRINLAPTAAWTRNNLAGTKRETPPEKEKKKEEVKK